MRAALVLEDLRGMKERIGEEERLLNFWSIMTFIGGCGSVCGKVKGTRFWRMGMRRRR